MNNVSDDSWHFVTEPNLNPPKVQVDINKSCAAEGLIFLAPHAATSLPASGQAGSLIMDREGNPVWFRPAGNVLSVMNSDFRTQELEGQSVLTFWTSGSTGPGPIIFPFWFILDNSYQFKAAISPRNGYGAAPNEFLITPQNTALFLSFRSIPTDLTPYGGPKDGFVRDYAVQEVNLITRELLFFWSALAHIPLTDSYVPVPTDASVTWDAYQLNSVGLTETPDDIIVSGRNTWTIYRINKPTAEIQWRLGGKQSDFKIGCRGEFAWQNDARLLPDNIITMLDNSCCPPDSPIPHGTPSSRGLTLRLNLSCMTAKFQQAYPHNPNLISSSNGNMQTLDNCNKFIGWGEQPFLSEYKRPRKAVYDAKILGNNQSDRAYLNEWVGTPVDLPKIAVRRVQDHLIVYVSWNGTTETKQWQVFGGSSPTDLSLIKTHKKSGFETDIPVHTHLTFFQVAAIDAQGQELARSAIVLSS